MTIRPKVFVRNWQVVHIASLRQLYLEAFKIVLVDTLPSEFHLPRFLQRKWIMVLPDLKSIRLELGLVARVAIERHLAFRPVFLPIDLLTVQKANRVHDFIVFVGCIIASLALEPKLMFRVGWQLQLRHSQFVKLRIEYFGLIGSHLIMLLIRSDSLEGNIPIQCSFLTMISSTATVLNLTS